MQRILMNGKIHRATVTQADLHYVGSLTIDADLMASANIVEGEQVQVVDITNGARLETYAITGPAGSGVIGVNGAAAHLVHPGDLVIVMSYAVFEESEVARHKPSVVHVDGDNRQIKVGTDPAEPVPGDPELISGRSTA
ncbi:aspartate 1-decarboxylase [Amycolatopsis endophytica]|uniref:Aspartate 1-decarboxylase n=1 Tax=Amycolatopsis endophytica TaxID=860233 RepID=A0A853BBY4_9PSEU|nr:aspartate 1-decarboxylase [Amycolatopsis endophytica]NYI92530.1 aspartate 1-decarboxylase [Amycolatopsis endophytica]